MSAAEQFFSTCRKVREMDYQNSKCIADIEGPWVDTEFVTNLIKRCRDAWNIPINDLSNEMLCTFLRQDIATDAILAEATRRLNSKIDDDSEMYDGELAAIVHALQNRNDR